jgi:predicted ArsR family transcriptional regulator
MLEGIFGNKTAEKILIHIMHYGEIHAAAIARDYSISENQVRNQLDRFENANIIISKVIGRARLYRFNPKSPYSKAVQEIIKIAYNSIPLSEKENLFKIRRRPRKKGKDIL